MKNTPVKEMLASWHFPRQWLAEQYIRNLFSGVTLSTTIFAEPQTGLSHFLSTDIRLQAQDDGFLPLYLDAGDKENGLFLQLTAHIEKIDPRLNLWEKSLRTWTGLMRRLSPHDASHAAVPDPVFSEGLHEQLVGLLAHHRLLFVVDNAHRLADNDQAHAFARLLARLLDQQRYRAFAIYGASQLTPWEAAFKNPRAPLFSAGATLHHLPTLNAIFVKQACSRLYLDAHCADAQHWFVALRHVPSSLFECLEGVMTGQFSHLDMACQDFLRRNAPPPTDAVPQEKTTPGAR